MLLPVGSQPIARSAKFDLLCSCAPENPLHLRADGNMNQNHRESIGSGSCGYHHLGLNDADERSGGNEHSADVPALGVVLLRGLQSNAEMRSAAGVAMRFTARLGYTADLSGGVQFAWFVRALSILALAAVGCAASF